MEARISNPAMTVPGALQALKALGAAGEQAGIPASTIGLIQLRASQINGCSVCGDSHSRYLKHSGETDGRLFAEAAWRDAPYFTEAERAALALTEAATRISDQSDPVPDAVWAEAARQYDEQALGALVIAIVTINAWNRINVITKQVAGARW